MSNRAEAKERAQNFGDPNYDARKRIVDDPAKLQQRLSGLDRDKYDVSGFSDKEIGMAMRGDSFGAEDYERLTGKKFGGDEPKEEPKPKPEPKPEPTPQTAENKPNTQGNTQGGPPMPGTQPGAPSFDKNASNFEANEYLKKQMEEDYAYSQYKTRNIARDSMAKAEQATNSSTRVKGLNDAVNKKTDYYRNRTDMQTLGLFGDIWNMKSFEWKAPQAPKPIETTYDTDTDF